MLAIAWQYLTGQAVATDPGDRVRPEWPPHPDRVLQALVAAWGEGPKGEDGAYALDWLLSQDPPQLSCPLDVDMAAPVKTFVPVNDIEGPRSAAFSEGHLTMLPSRRTRKERFFPAVNVGTATCALVWPVAAPAEHSAALSALCSGVTRIGHSRSLVRTWLTEVPPEVTLKPVPTGGEYQLRVAGPGRFQALLKAYADGGVGWRRPPLARWQAYGRAQGEKGVAFGEFAERLIVMRRASGVRLGLADAWEAVAAFRGLLIAATDQRPAAKRLISGHEADGTPLRDTHAAIVPLGFVSETDSAGGGRHADGRLMGLGIALPRSIDPDSEQDILLGLAEAFRSRPDGMCSLVFGRRGTAQFVPDTSENPAYALRSETWTRASTTWGSVTPFVLDRLPPRRHQDAEEWTRAQLIEACGRQNLPHPSALELLPVSPFLGAPAAQAFSPLLRKDGTRRWHLHARITFDTPVVGPLLLGAGRYRGYGLFRPMRARS